MIDNKNHKRKTSECQLNGEASSKMVIAFGEDKAFMEGWDRMVINGYKEDELVAGPESSWLGAGHLEGNISLLKLDKN